MSTTETNAKPAPAKPAKPVVAPAIGQPVWYYADHTRTKGMKSYDWDVPFAAVVAYAPSDRLVNLSVIAHDGMTFAIPSVAVFHDDDGDDRNALSHCSLEAPKPKEVIAVSGVAGQPIPLNFGPNATADADLGNSVASVTLKFTVPAGDTYLFISDKAAIHAAFGAGTKPQSLALSTAQIAAGALTDLSLTTGDESEVLLAVAVTEQNASGVIGKTYRFNEAITVGAAAPEPVGSGVPTPGGAIESLGPINGGSSYNNGVYPGVPLTGGSGSGATASITVTAGVVTAVVPSSPGIDYEVGDMLSVTASTLGAAGTGFSVSVTAVSAGDAAPAATGPVSNATTAPFIGGAPPRVPTPAAPMQGQAGT
jgi:hypothetical protein